MEIRNKWVVQDKLPDCEPTYFVGMVENACKTGETALFERLSSQTRVYKSKRGAEQAVRIIGEHYESPYIKAEFIEHAEVDVVEDNPRKSDFAIDCKNSDSLSELLPVKSEDVGGWLPLADLRGKYPMMLKKKCGSVFQYAIAYNNNDLRYLPADEIFAWMRYFDECKILAVKKIRARRVAEGKDPDGMDEWRVK